MLLMFAAILMVGICSNHFTLGNSFAPRHVGGLRRGLRAFALAIAVALVSVPAGASARAPDKTSAEIRTTPATPTATIAREAGSAQGQDYAAREASAKDLEKFEGGDTIILGGSALVIILLVVLIVVLI